MFLQLLLAITLLFQGTMAIANMKPYVLGNRNTDLDVHALQDKLKAAGFEILGTSTPAKGYTTVCFTHKDLENEAVKAQVPFGAVLRASLVQNNGKTELSYCSPHYWACAMGLQGASSDAIAQKLKDTLGNEEAFGSAKGMNEKTLRRYNYAMGMPRLTDLDKLNKFKDSAEAKNIVTQGIMASKEVNQVYALDLDKGTRIIGVSFRDNKAADATVLSVTNAGPGPKLGGLYGPYEMFVKDGAVMAPRGYFELWLHSPISV